MNMSVLVSEKCPASIDVTAAEIEQSGACLRIITSIDDGYGVVPVMEEGGVLLRKGEVAVYKEERPRDLPPGLYCIEHQRPVSCSTRADSRRIIMREVVYVRPCRRAPGDGNWEYVSLRSKVIGGVRRYAQAEGPIYPWAAGDLLLGPVVGIYVPSSFTLEGRS
ncbi:MAG: hypothetical protein AB7E24_11930 [Novosphingobium sp.]